MPEWSVFADKLLTSYMPSAFVLTLFVTVIAYLRAPKLKVLVFSMPIPFTCAYLATRIPIDATYIFGLILVVMYHWVVYWVHISWKKPLWLGIGMGLVFYLSLATGMQKLEKIYFPEEAEFPFFAAVGIAATLWLIALLRYKPATETGHRTTAPWWLKMPMIFLIAIVMFSLKGMLAGAVATFPYAGVFTSYEMRHNLRALATQFTVTVIAIGLMMISMRVTTVSLGWEHPWPLVLGWVVVMSTMMVVYPLRIRARPGATAVEPAGETV